MPKKTPRTRRVRIQCDVEGYEEFWIEYDVSTWGIDILTSIPYLPLYEVVSVFIPQHSIDWFVIGDDGAQINHPGPGKSKILWSSIWRNVGPVTGQALWRWLGVSVFSAMGEAITPDLKSAETNGDVSQGGDGASADGAATSVDD